MQVRNVPAQYALAIALLCGCSKPPAKESGASSGQSVLTVSPASGTGMQQVFEVKMSGWKGQKPPLLGLLINQYKEGAKACYLYADLENRRILLVNDSGEGSRELGDAPLLANSQCEVRREGTISTVNGTEMTARFNVHFQSAFAGEKALFAGAQDVSAGGMDLQPSGSWIVR